MKQSLDNPALQEKIIAALLWHGTLLACIVIAAGMILGGLQTLGLVANLAHIGYKLVTIGVVIFVLLPITRVVLMLLMFLRSRNYVYAAISALVLGIIGIGLLIGLH